MERVPDVENKIDDLYKEASQLRERYPDTTELVLAVGKYIREKTRGFNKPESLLESRLTSAKDAFEGKMFSCGTQVTMAAEMLRHVGLEVKMIHGECEESIDHGWFKVLDPDSGEWMTFDLTRKDGMLPESSVAKIEADNWSDIEDFLKEEEDSSAERFFKKYGREWSSEDE